MMSRREKRDLHADFKTQTGALLRKQLIYQKRNKGQNCCLIIAPVFFCVLLFIIQAIVNRALDTAELKCGCLCRFGYDDPTDYTATCGPDSDSGRPCEPSRFLRCDVRDTTECGVQYSYDAQAFFCAIDQPTTFPELLPIPPLNQSITTPLRARPWSLDGQVPLLLTAESSSFASSLASSMVPSFDAAAFQSDVASLITDLETLVLQNKFYEAIQAVASSLSMMAVTYGGQYKSVNDYYLDPAFLPTSSGGNPILYAMQPDCAAFQTTCDAISTAANTQYGFPITSTGNSTVSGDIIALTLVGIDIVCLEALPVTKSSIDDVNRLLYCGFKDAICPEFDKVVGSLNEYVHAFDFADSSSSVMRLRLWYNDTNKLVDDRGQPPFPLRLGKGLNYGINTWLRDKLSVASDVIQLTFISATPKVATRLTLDFGSLLGPGFFLWVLELLLPFMLQALVYEKEKGLRIMMKMHGLDNKTYITVTYLWYLAVYVVYFFLLMFFGAITKLNFFKLNNAGIQIIHYFLHGNLQIALAFFLSCFFKSPKTAAVAGYLWVFISGFICGFLLVSFIEQQYSWVWALELIPGFSLYRGLYEFAQYAFRASYQGKRAMQFSNLSDKGNGMVDAWIIMIVEWAILMPLAIYLEQVMGDRTGVKRHPLFFLEYCGLRKHRRSEYTSSTVMTGGGHFVSEEEGTIISMDNGDVADERDKALSLTRNDAFNYPIIVHNLRKVYPPVNGGKRKVAVRSLSLAVEKGECFGLLGPNGAGKTTSITMLTGFQEPTSGTAYVDGFDIRTEMNSIYSRMGVCPQHDILWETLTGREHLLFYGRLKKLTGAALQDAVLEALRGVNLIPAANKRVGQYSGGMKRRLSVAISLMGAPGVVYMDEPSTGLDPASRRALWDVVRSNKKDKSIILTTHSMQEAEVLCDRLGIFVDGQLYCLGSPKELSSKFGGYVMVTITTNEEYNEQVVSFMRSLAPKAEVKYALGGTQKFVIGAQDVSLSRIFEAMNSDMRKFPLIDFGVHHADLENVFIDIVQERGGKSALAH